MDWSELLERLTDPGDAFIPALRTTIIAAVLAEALGIALGLATVLMKLSHRWPLRVISDVYAFVTRGIPAIVHLFFWYYGVGIILGFNLFPNEASFLGMTVQGGLLAGIVGLGVAEGGYMREIFRGSIQAVDVGQTESAIALGMSTPQVMRRVVLPQAVRVMVPTVGNQFNGMLKYTSLLAFIGVYEIFQDSQIYYASTFQPAVAFVAVACWYLLLTGVWEIVQRFIERSIDLRRRSPKPLTAASSGGAS